MSSYKIVSTQSMLESLTFLLF